MGKSENWEKLIPHLHSFIQSPLYAVSAKDKEQWSMIMCLRSQYSTKILEEKMYVIEMLGSFNQGRLHILPQFYFFYFAIFYIMLIWEQNSNIHLDVLLHNLEAQFLEEIA